MEKQLGTLIKTFKGYRTTSNGYKYETLLRIYRDSDGNKKTIYDDRPTIDYYIIKDKSSQDAITPPLYISLDKVEKHTVYSDNLYRDIAVNTGALSFYDRIKFNYGVSSYNMKNLFRSPLLYEADIDLEDQYIAKFYRKYDINPNYKLHKAYFDIENDIYNFTGFPNPDDAPCPVCLITLIDDNDSQSYTFILRNKQNTQLVEFETEIDSFKLYMHDIVIKNDNVDMAFNFEFFDDEIELIQAFFDKVHNIDPDYCGGWNISYDIPTLQNRLVRLFNKSKSGASKNKNISTSAKQAACDVICDSKYIIQKTETGADMYLTPKAYYSIGKGKIGKRNDSFSVLDGINWIDQMHTYANIHVSGGKLDSYKLDNVAYVELGKEKLPFGPGETIRNQLYKNTKRFVEYNIRDVLLLKLIEDKTKDIEMVQKISDITVTRKDKCFKKSISLTNFVNKFANDQNLVMSTNKNVSYGNETSFYNNNFLPNSELLETDKSYLKLLERKDKYGAYVSDPSNNDEYGVEIFKNKLSKFLWDLVCDMDFSSLYPSIVSAFNLDSRNIVGKFYCVDDEIKENLKKNYNCADMFALSIKDDKSSEDDDDIDISDDDENIDSLISDSKNETDDLGSILVDSVISRDWNMIGHIFFDLPTTEELLGKLERR